MMKKLCMGLCLLALSGQAMATEESWTLNAKDSSLHLVSVKKNSVGEVFHFSSLHGAIEQGEARLDIDLASISSGVEIRDQRMRKHLFEVTRFATATVVLPVNPDWLHIAPGDFRDVKVEATLSLHGVTRSVPASLRIVGLQDGLMVGTLRPILVQAKDFGLDGGIETLRALAKLSSIVQVVPVDLQLHFQRPARP